VMDRIGTAEKRYVYIFSRVKTFLHWVCSDRILDFTMTLIV
jgi:hypothetical protein